MRPNRQLVTRQQLLDILNAELRQTPGCDEDVSFKDLVWQRRDVGPDECNWEIDQLRFSGRAADSHCVQAAQRILGEAMQRYNVQWEE